MTHVPPEVFMTLMKEASVMVGNSSAGIRESCIFGTPTLNIGSRQEGDERRTMYLRWHHPQWNRLMNGSHDTKVSDILLARMYWIP